MKITQREMNLGIATLAAVLIGATWYMFDGKYDEWRSMQTEIERLKFQIQTNERLIERQGIWQEELKERRSALRVFSTELASVSPELNKSIEDMAHRHGLEITRIQTFNEKSNKDLHEQGLNCQWKGSLESVVGFLTELQQQGARYDARTVNIQPEGKNTSRLKGNMVIQCAYLRKTPEEIASDNPAKAAKAPKPAQKPTPQSAPVSTNAPTASAEPAKPATVAPATPTIAEPAKQPAPPTSAPPKRKTPTLPIPAPKPPGTPNEN